MVVKQKGKLSREREKQDLQTISGEGDNLINENIDFFPPYFLSMCHWWTKSLDLSALHFTHVISPATSRGCHKHKITIEGMNRYSLRNGTLHEVMSSVKSTV